MQKINFITHFFLKTLVNRDLRIEFVFPQITLSSFCEIRKSIVRIFVFRETTKFLFTLTARQIAYILLQKVLNCTLFACIWIAFWPETPNWGLTALPQTL